MRTIRPSLRRHWLALVSAIAIIACTGLDAYAATAGEEKATPLSPAEAAKLGRQTPDGLIFSGDIIYYSDVVIQSGIVANRWPNGQIFIEFAASIPDANRQAFMNACQAWTSGSPVSCMLRNGQANYVLVAEHSGGQCAGADSSCSAVGMRNGKQDLFVYFNHWSNSYVLQHEIGHAFGLIHEHQRQDRDAYITVLGQNVQADALGQFAKWGAVTATEYDFESIMHYNNCQFTNKSGCSTAAPIEATSTMMPKACNRDLVGGTTITSLDLDGMRAAYAPTMFGLMQPKRSAACGIHDLSPDQAAAMCGGGACAQAGPVTYNKVENLHYDDCGGFVVDPNMSCPAQKTLLSTSYKSRIFSCGFLSLQTKHDWYWSCGCGKQALQKACTDAGVQWDDVAIEKLRESTNERDVAAVRYIDQVRGWSKNGLVEQRTADKVGALLLRNYTHDSFRERLFSVLCKMRLIIELSLYVRSGFQLPHSDFEKLATAEGVQI